MSADMLDSRLLRIGTHDATPGSILFPTGAGFTVNLENVNSEIQQSVIGYSVESVGFYNLAPNIDEGSRRLVISHVGGPTVYTLPVGQVDLDELVLLLNAASPNFVWSALGERLRIAPAIGVVGPILAWGEGYTDGVTDASDQLATLLGLAPRGAAAIAVNPAITTLQNHFDLGGQRVAYLHAHTLAHNKYSFDGEGLSVSFSCSFPINVPYGNFCLVYPNQYQKAGVWWDQSHNIREIDLRLRSIRGDLLNLQGTEWFVTLRLFME